MKYLRQFRSFLFLCVLAFAGFVIGNSSADAKTTEWINYKAAKREFTKIRRHKAQLQSVRCKSADGYSPHIDSVLFKLTWSKNAGSTKWRMIWGSTGNYTRNLRKAMKKGERIVSHDQFTRPKSGLRVQCAVLH